MKLTIKLGIIVVALQCAGGMSCVKAQDIHFSQFYETSILRNPALTGIFTGDFKVSAVYRTQWSSISAPFQTGAASAEMRMPVGKDFFSLGLLAYYDRAGSIDMRTLGVYPAINYNKSLEDGHSSFLSVGFAGGYLQRSFDPTKMSFNAQFQNGAYNPGNATGEHLPDVKVQNWDLGAGISYSSNWGEGDEGSYFIGVSGYHFTQPKRNFFQDGDIVRLDMKWNGSAGLSYKIDGTYNLQAHVSYTKQGGYQEIIGGALLGWRKYAASAADPLVILYAGALYRYDDAIIPTIKMDYMRYSFALSYDVTVSSLKTAAQGQGGVELTLCKIGLFKDPRHEMSRTVCPRFAY